MGAQLIGVSPQKCRRERVVVVCDMWGNEKKYAAAHCTNITSSCPVYHFLIKPAQLGKPKTLG